MRVSFVVEVAKEMEEHLSFRYYVTDSGSG